MIRCLNQPRNLGYNHCENFSDLRIKTFINNSTHGRDAPICVLWRAVHVPTISRDIAVGGVKLFEQAGRSIGIFHTVFVFGTEPVGNPKASNQLKTMRGS